MDVPGLVLLGKAPRRAREVAQLPVLPQAAGQGQVLPVAEHLVEAQVVVVHPRTGEGEGAGDELAAALPQAEGGGQAEHRHRPVGAVGAQPGLQLGRLDGVVVVPLQHHPAVLQGQVRRAVHGALQPLPLGVQLPDGQQEHGQQPQGQEAGGGPGKQGPQEAFGLLSVHAHPSSSL